MNAWYIIIYEILSEYIIITNLYFRSVPHTNKLVEHCNSDVFRIINIVSCRGNNAEVQKAYQIPKNKNIFR